MHNERHFGLKAQADHASQDNGVIDRTYKLGHESPQKRPPSLVNWVMVLGGVALLLIIGANVGVWVLRHV